VGCRDARADDDGTAGGDLGPQGRFILFDNLLDSTGHIWNPSAASGNETIVAVPSRIHGVAPSSDGGRLAIGSNGSGGRVNVISTFTIRDR
jgi:hypothetical protein